MRARLRSPLPRPLPRPVPLTLLLYALMPSGAWPALAHAAEPDVPAVHVAAHDAEVHVAARANARAD